MEKSFYIFAGAIMLLTFATGRPCYADKNYVAPVVTPEEPLPAPNRDQKGWGGPEVSILSVRTADLAYGNITDLTFSVVNSGNTNDIYVLSAKCSLPWIDLSAIPASIAVAAGQKKEVTLHVTVPSNVPIGTKGAISLEANTDPGIIGFGTHTIDLTVVGAAPK